MKNGLTDKEVIDFSGIFYYIRNGSVRPILFLGFFFRGEGGKVGLFLVEISQNRLSYTHHHISHKYHVCHNVFHLLPHIHHCMFTPLEMETEKGIEEITE